MFLEQYTVKTKHFRKSKLGAEHAYYRNKTVLVFRCDSCSETFERERGQMDPKRLNNNYFHCCSNCDAKKFAQKRGVERKRVWDLSASSDIPINKL